MPRPVYLICAESGVEDTRTHLVSLFNIIEKVTFRPLPEGADVSREDVRSVLAFRSIAVWMREETDSPEQKFECQIRLHIPGKSDGPAVTEQTPFAFTQPLQRFIIDVRLGAVVESGILLVEHRIKKVGEEAWLAQTYPIIVEQDESLNQTTPEPPSEAPTP